MIDPAKLPAATVEAAYGAYDDWDGRGGMKLMGEILAAALDALLVDDEAIRRAWVTYVGRTGLGCTPANATAGAILAAVQVYPWWRRARPPRPPVLGFVDESQGHYGTDPEAA